MNSNRIFRTCFTVLAGIGIWSPAVYAAADAEQTLYCPASFEQCDPETYYSVDQVTTEEVVDAEITTDATDVDPAFGTSSGPSMGPAPERPRSRPPVVTNPPPATRPTDGVVTPIDEAQIILDKIINLGKTLWKIVEANRPVVNLKTEVATALPQGIMQWEQMDGWQVPVTKVYKTTYKNPYGMKVVQFSYRVIYTYGGSVNGRGNYLTQITVYPADLKVMWGYTFNAQVKVPTVLNMGTKDFPIGGAEIQVHWSIDTVMNHLQSSRSYFVKGNGEFHDISDGTPTPARY